MGRSLGGVQVGECLSRGVLVQLGSCIFSAHASLKRTARHHSLYQPLPGPYFPHDVYLGSCPFEKRSCVSLPLPFPSSPSSLATTEIPSWWQASPPILHPPHQIQDCLHPPRSSFLLNLPYTIAKSPSSNPPASSSRHILACQGRTGKTQTPARYARSFRFITQSRLWIFPLRDPSEVLL